MHNITIFNDVFFAFDANLAGVTASLLRAKCYIISILDNLGTNKTLLEVGVDNARSLRCFCATRIGPSTRFVCSRCEEGFEVEQAVSRLNYTAPNTAQTATCSATKTSATHHVTHRAIRAVHSPNLTTHRPKKTTTSISSAERMWWRNSALEKGTSSS